MAAKNIPWCLHKCLVFHLGESQTLFQRFNILIRTAWTLFITATCAGFRRISLDNPRPISQCFMCRWNNRLLLLLLPIIFKKTPSQQKGFKKACP